MKSESIKSFITYYLESLPERTRVEKSGAKWGIDWVAYNLGLAQFGKPVRLPFLRGGDTGYPKSKVEAEFGVDAAFLSDDGLQLVIFVLKDEALTNSTWTGNDFDRDLRMAMAPDLAADGLDRVNAVTVILAYNKDDQQNGIEAYDRFVATAPTKLRDMVALKFRRWNLSELVEQTLQHILSPSLLPQKFFGQLSYLSAQALDFKHGSEPWEKQLLPAWRRFLEDVIGENAGARGAAVIPVALIVVRQHAQSSPSFETGWIDLLEWAALALWRLHAEKPDAKTLPAIQRFWDEFYLAELDRFYRAHIEALGTEQVIDQVGRGGYVGAVAASYIAHWHLGRISLLGLAVAQTATTDPTAQNRRLREIANWTAMLANANVSVFRPMLDIQHIEWFLLIELWRSAGRLAETEPLLGNLIERLYLRRLGSSELPFLDGTNSWDNVFEQVATGGEEKLILEQSSYFVLMLMELSALFPDAVRDEFIAAIHRRLVLGTYDAGDPGTKRPLDLMSWLPPDDWARKVFSHDLEEGQAVNVGPFARDRKATAAEILPGMRGMVDQMRAVAPFVLPSDIPVAATVLACLRHRTPIPPELWRRTAFPLPQH